MLTVDDTAHCVVEVHDVAEETFSMVGDIAHAVCQLEVSNGNGFLSSSTSCRGTGKSPGKYSSIEVNYDGLADTIISGTEGGRFIESVIVVPRMHEPQERSIGNAHRARGITQNKFYPPFSTMKHPRRIARDRGD